MLRRAVARSSIKPWPSAIARPPFLPPSRTYSKNRPPQPPPSRPPHSGSRIVGSPKHGPTAFKGGPGMAQGSKASIPTSDSNTHATSQTPPPQSGQQPPQDSSSLSSGPRSSKQAPGSRPGSETSHGLPYSEEQKEFDTPASPKQNAIGEAASEEPQAEIPLHDLTKGIPSTLDAELDQASRKQNQAEAEEGEAPRPASGGGEGRGRGREDKSMPASAYVTSAERRRNQMMMWTFISMLALVLTGPIYLGRNWETDEEEKAHPDAPSGWGIMRFYNRVYARLFSTLEYYSEPAFEKLLPDPDPQFARPYTLVVSLEDLLVHSEWTRENGWRVAKRPGVDYFLRYLNQYYEIVIFTSIPSAIAGPILMKLDPFGIVIMRLFREATRYKNGEYIKDLSFLNRDLSKIILLDTVPSHASAQPDNAIILPKWNGSPGDTGLVSLIPFLEYTAAMGLEDTRPVIKSFAGKDVASEFARREALARQRFEEKAAADKLKKPKRSAAGFLGSMLGIKGGAGGPMGGMVMMETGPDGVERPVPVQSPGEGFEQGKMLHDQIRERGQKQYEMMEREIRENAEKWLKEIAAEEEKFKRESVKTMTSSLGGWFGKGEEKKGSEDTDKKA